MVINTTAGGKLRRKSKENAHHTSANRGRRPPNSLPLQGAPDHVPAVGSVAGDSAPADTQNVKNKGSAKPKKQAFRAPAKLARETFRTSREMDFFSEKELVI